MTIFGHSNDPDFIRERADVQVTDDMETTEDPDGPELGHLDVWGSCGICSEVLSSREDFEDHLLTVHGERDE